MAIQIPECAAARARNDLVTEARVRLRKSAPSLTDDQWLTWLAFVDAHGGHLVLTLDGVHAEYSQVREIT